MIDERDIPLGDQGLYNAPTEGGQPVPDPVTEVRHKFDYCTMRFRYQREQEQADLRFADIDEWEVGARAAREGEITEDGLAYAKPTRSLHAADPGIEMALQDARSARLAVKLVSRGTKPSQTTRYLEQYIQQIQRESRAQDIRMSAVERMLKAGFGVYKLGIRHVEKNPKLDAAAFDQEPFVENIRDQATCLYDPDANMIDKSDGRFWIQTFLMPLEIRKKKWKDVPVTVDGAYFEDPTVKSEWYDADGDGNNKHVRIAYYFYRSAERRLILFHPDFGNPVYADEAPDELKALHKAKDRRVRARFAEDETIRLRVVDGHNVLEESTYAGKYFPFIPVFGRHSFVNGADRYKGIISTVKEHCESLNLMFSTAVQAVAQPLSWIMGDEQADEELQEIWDLLWKNPRVRLPYRPQVEQGNLLPAPTPAPLVADINLLVTLIQQTRDLIHYMTGLPQFTTNANAPRERSAASTEEIGVQGSRLYSVYIDQWATISMLLEGMGLIDLIGVLLDRPGRRLRLRTADGKESEIVIKQPFYHDHDGNAHTVPHEACGGTGFLRGPLGEQIPDPGCEGTGVAPRDEAPPAVENFRVQYVDFSEVQDVIDVTVGRQEDNAKRERVGAMSLIASAAPDFVAYYIDQFFRDLGLPELADRIARQLPQTQDDPESAISPIAKQMLAEKDAQLAAVSDALKEAQEFIRTEQVKLGGQLQIARTKGEMDIEKERAKREGDLVRLAAEHGSKAAVEGMRGDVLEKIADIKATVDMLTTRMKLDTQERIAGAEIAEEAREADMAEANRAIDQQIQREEGSANRASAERTAAADRAAKERQSSADRAAKERTATADRQSSERTSAADRGERMAGKAADIEESRRQADLTKPKSGGKDK